MKTIYFVTTDDRAIDEDLAELIGECEGFMDERGIITWWSCNDANWRKEYFSELMRYLNVTVLYDEKLNIDFATELGKNLGYGDREHV